MTGSAPGTTSQALPARPDAAPQAGGAAGFIQRNLGWIWRINGTVDLPPGQTAAAALDRLAPLFDAPNTNHERTGDALVFIKRDPASQDKLAVFDSGVLQIAEGNSGPVLRFEMTSRILLACFLAPLLFLLFAQVTLYTGEMQKAKAAAEAKAEKAKAKPKKPPKPEIVLNPIDVALGAPAPKTRKQMAKEKAEKEKEPVSATPAYVFAGIFAALYLIGRILEARLANRLFRKALHDAA